jgi:hypothetical protein
MSDTRRKWKSSLLPPGAAKGSAPDRHALGRDRSAGKQDRLDREIAAALARHKAGHEELTYTRLG